MANWQGIASLIDAAFEERARFSPGNAPKEVFDAVEAVIDGLDRGAIRVAEKREGDWHVNQWIKKAVLLSFRLRDNRLMEGGETRYFDKVEPKFARYGEADFREGGFRVVPPAAARRGCYIAKNVVLMPSYVNIAPTSMRAPWSIPGPRWAPAPRSARTCTSPAAWASAACWNRCRPGR